MKIPKYNIWENIVYKDDLITYFWKIQSIEIINNRMIMYNCWKRNFLESEIKLAVLEVRNKKSEFYWIYPFN